MAFLQRGDNEHRTGRTEKSVHSHADKLMGEAPVRKKSFRPVEHTAPMSTNLSQSSRFPGDVQNITVEDVMPIGLRGGKVFVKAGSEWYIASFAIVVFLVVVYYNIYFSSTGKCSGSTPPQRPPTDPDPRSDPKVVEHSGWKATWVLLRRWMMSSDYKWRARGVVLLVTIHWLAREAAFALIITKVSAEVLNSITVLQSSKDLTRVRTAFVYSFLANMFIAVPLFHVIDPWVEFAFCVSFRNYATGRIVDSYMDSSGRAFYQIKLREAENQIDNPDQRICDDLRNISEGIYTILAHSLSAAFGCAFWFTIIFHQGGPFLVGLAVGMASLHLAIAYGLFGKWLVNLQKKMQAVTADLRCGLMRVRENAEAVALSNGVGREKKRVNGLYDRVIDTQCTLTLVSMLFGCSISFVNIFPSMILWIYQLPAIMNGSIGVGDALRINQGYEQCSKVVDFFAQSFTTIMMLQANSQRLDQLWLASRQANSQQVRFPAAPREAQEDGEDTEAPKVPYENVAQRDHSGVIVFEVSKPPVAFELDRLFVGAPGSDKQVGGVTVECKIGTGLLVTGSSGLGKTSVLRALVGLWHDGSGIVRRTRAELIFLPSVCLIPHGTLLEVLTYPETLPLASTDAEALHKIIETSLSRSQLSTLLDKFDLEGEPRDWSVVLSAGEKQRVGFARLFVKLELQEQQAKQDRLLAVLDESTSAVDITAETALYTELCKELQGGRLLAIASVGHRPSLRRFHDTELQIGELQDVDPENILSHGTWQTLDESKVCWQHIRLPNTASSQL